MARTGLDAKNLAALGAERLAELLIEISAGSTPPPNGDCGWNWRVRKAPPNLRGRCAGGSQRWN